MHEPSITEHLVNYDYKGKTHTMLVKKDVSQYQEVFIVRTRKGEVTLQYYDYKWNVVSLVKMDYMLAQAVGDAILAAGL